MLMCRTLRQHWPEYLIEAWGLGTFMVSASVFATLLFAPQSPLPSLLPSDSARLALMGIAMGLTALGIVVSPWGRLSGAHINPAFTITFWRLGKVAHWDAVFYIGAQFVGGLAGVLLMIPLLGQPFTQVPVHYAVTVPGPHGRGGGVRRRARHCRDHDGGGPQPEQPAAAGALDAIRRRRAGGELGHLRVAVLRVRHEPRADGRLGAAGRRLDRDLAVRHHPGRRDARCRPAVHDTDTASCAKIYQHATFFCALARPEHSPPRCIFCRDRVDGQ